MWSTYIPHRFLSYRSVVFCCYFLEDNIAVWPVCKSENFCKYFCLIYMSNCAPSINKKSLVFSLIGLMTQVIKDIISQVYNLMYLLTHMKGLMQF